MTTTAVQPIVVERTIAGAKVTVTIEPTGDLPDHVAAGAQAEALHVNRSRWVAEVATAGRQATRDAAIELGAHHFGWPGLAARDAERAAARHELIDYRPPARDPNREGLRL